MLLTIGPIAFLAALIAVPIYYTIYRCAPEPKRHASGVRYVLVTLGIAAAAYAIGAIVGVAVACSSASAGNLCGLIGLFGAGPLFAAFAILGYAHFWSRHARQAP